MAGAIPSAVVNGAAGITIAALVIAALYAGRDFLIPLALAGLLSFIPSPLVGRGCRSGASRTVFRLIPSLQSSIAFVELQTNAPTPQTNDLANLILVLVTKKPLPLDRHDERSHVGACCGRTASFSILRYWLQLHAAKGPVHHPQPT